MSKFIPMVQMISGNSTSAQDHSPTRWQSRARTAWYMAAVLSLAIAISAFFYYLQTVHEGYIAGNLTANPSPVEIIVNVLAGVLSLATALLSLFLASLLFYRRPKDRMALFLSFYLMAFTVFAGPTSLLGSIIPYSFIIFGWTVVIPLILYPSSCLLFLLFPDGCFSPDWSHWVFLASLITAPVMSIAFLTSFRSRSPNPGSIVGSLLLLAGISSTVYVQFYRYRHIVSPKQKLQIKWFVYGLGLMVLMVLINSFPYIWKITLPDGMSQLVWHIIDLTKNFISSVILPVSLTIAIMRHQLYDIDTLINRTLVYGTLTAGVVVAYALVVGGLGILFQTQSSLLVAFLATGLVAVLFQPVRERLQRAVNRMMYGERDDPATVFARLGNLLEASTSPQEILPGLVRTIAQTLKLPYTAIELGKEEDREVAATYGKPTSELERFALVYQLEDVGSLVVSPRSQGEELTLADRRLLENIAHQAGTVTHAVRLTNELQRSRLRLVTTREEERRRLRRDLHDELGPQLASQTLIIEALEKRLYKDPASAARLLEELKKQSRRAMQDIRQIVYGLRPPSLDQLGLVGAVQEALTAHQRSGVSFHLQAKEKMPPLPAAVEVAIYHIVQEAVTNVIRHARAKRCMVRIDYEDLEEDAEMRLTIDDDGIGLRDDPRNGVGLSSMHERADELGGDFKVVLKPEGGTQISVRLPIPREAT